MNNNLIIRRGDIFYIDIPKDEFDPHKQVGCRPCVIISNDINNRNSSRVNYIPLTSRDKKFIPTHVVLTSTSCLNMESIALCECIDGINKIFLRSKIGRVSVEDMKKIEDGLDIQVNPNRRLQYVYVNESQKCVYA